MRPTRTVDDGYVAASNGALAVDNGYVAASNGALAAKPRLLGFVPVGLVLKVTCNKCTTPKLSELPYSTKIPAILVVERREWREISSDMGKKSGFFLMSGAFDTEGLDKVLLMSQQP
jgi:hypothetical protein